MDIEDVIQDIMTRGEPYPPFSVQMEADDSSDIIKSVNEQFDFFISLVCHAFRIRYGNDDGRVSFHDITPTGIYDMQERFKCLGYTFSLRMLDEDELPETPGTRVYYDNDDIKECKLLLWNYGSETPSAYCVKYVQCTL